MIRPDPQCKHGTSEPLSEYQITSCLGESMVNLGCGSLYFALQHNATYALLLLLELESRASLRDATDEINPIVH